MLASADRHKGRFRAFLLTDCIHVLANAHDRAVAFTRGGGRTFVSIDSGAAGKGVPCADQGHDLTPERLFERDWGADPAGRGAGLGRGGRRNSGRRAA